jgi:predicted nuclease of predicted toxin-antitoxin system
MSRLLLDQGLAPQAAAILRQRGVDAVHVSAIGMERAEDAQILARARHGGRVCITPDHDLHTHLAMTGDAKAPWRGVRRFRQTAITSVFDACR